MYILQRLVSLLAQVGPVSDMSASCTIHAMFRPALTLLLPSDGMFAREYGAWYFDVSLSICSCSLAQIMRWL